MNNIRLFLALRSKSGRWLANQLNVDEKTVSNWKLNRNQPTWKYIFQIAKALECQPSDLINNDYEHEEKEKTQEEATSA